MICANITGFFYTVWTCLKGEESYHEVPKSGFMENLSLIIEEKAYRLKSKIK